MGIADFSRHDGRAKTDHVLPHPHTEELGGNQVPEFMQAHRDGEPDEKKNDAENVEPESCHATTLELKSDNLRHGRTKFGTLNLHLRSAGAPAR